MQRKANLLPHGSVSPIILSDVKVYSWGIVIRIQHSKTNQFQERVAFISLPCMSDPGLCPIRALLHSLVLSHSLHTRDRALFSFSGNGQIHALSASVFSKKLDRIFAKVGLRGYSAHSFRRGGATVALVNGVAPEIIKE